MSGRERRIVTNLDVDAPVQLQWSAVDDRTYEPGCPIGRGRTEADAVRDLREQLDDLVIDDLQEDTP